MTADLPPYLQRTEPMELDDLPLQVALLTGEIVAQRNHLQALEREMDRLAIDLISRRRGDA